MIQAPPGSGYISDDEEDDDQTSSSSPFPTTYQPLMEYPGTMRPGKTRENMPYEDLPLSESDPDPVPWPHFQEIEWHHNWYPPNPYHGTMEDFIDSEGRWATVEEEAAMRVDVRAGARERRVEEERVMDEGGSGMIITDDEEDEVDGSSSSKGNNAVELGEGVADVMGVKDLVDDDVGPDKDAPVSAVVTDEKEEEEDEEEEEEDDDDDDFLMDLGLDDEPDNEELNKLDGTTERLTKAMQDMIDQKGAESEEEEEEEVVVSRGIDSANDDAADLDIDLGLLTGDGEGVPDVSDVPDLDDDDAGDDDDDENDDDDDDSSRGGITMIADEDEDVVVGNDGIATIPLDDFSTREDMGDDEGFDDGGFDYDEGGDGGSDDVW